jgi:hypothetical protein
MPCCRRDVETEFHHYTTPSNAAPALIPLPLASKLIPRQLSKKPANLTSLQTAWSMKNHNRVHTERMPREKFNAPRTESVKMQKWNEGQQE